MNSKKRLFKKVSISVIVLILYLVIVAQAEFVTHKIGNVRLRLETEWGFYKNNVFIKDDTLSSSNVTYGLLDEELWENNKDGSLRYKDSLKPKDELSLSIKVCIDGKSTGNEYQGASYRIKYHWEYEFPTKFLHVLSEEAVIDGNYDNWNPGDCNIVTLKMRYYIEDPPIYEPPIYEPPTKEPPIEEPPTWEPPIEEPPTEEPPIEDKPIDNESPEEPETTNPENSGGEETDYPSELPQTGEYPPIILYGFGMILIIVGMSIVRRKK